MDIHTLVLQGMQDMYAQFLSQGVKLHLPPPSSLTLGTRYTAIEVGKSLTAEFKYDKRLTNPLGTVQGGFFAAMFDDVCGPLTYMAAKRPVMTIELSTSFMRPFTAENAPITIKADVVSQTRSLLVVKAEAHSKDGKLLATFSSHNLISSDKNLELTRIGA